MAFIEVRHEETPGPALAEASLQELRDVVRGEIVTPGDDGYEEASRIWNGAHDGHRPALVVRCTGVADVCAAVGFARGTSWRSPSAAAATASPASRPSTAGS